MTSPFLFGRLVSMKKTETILLIASLILVVGMLAGIGHGIQKDEENRRTEIASQGKLAAELGLPATANPFKDDSGKIWLDAYMDVKR